MVRGKKRGYLIRSFICVALGLLFLCGIMVTAHGEETQKKPVRVGFFAFDGYHMMDENGQRSGYGYEYLQHMAKYAGFFYEYIGYDKSWKDMFAMLDSGEIDLLTSALKTPDRMERYDFSERPIGTSRTILTVRAGDTRYMLDDYTKMSGIRVGMLRANSRNESFAQFARQNGFTYKPVYFESIAELTAALQARDGIDALVTSSLRRSRNEWTIAAFDPAPFYVIVKKGNRPLLDKVNYAIEQMEMFDANLSATLYNKYYSAETGNDIFFTIGERKFIQEIRDQGKPLQMLICPDRRPLSYFENEDPSGIIPDIMRKILERTGLPWQIVRVDSRQEYKRLIATKGAAICLDFRYDFNKAEQCGYKLSDPYLDVTISRITRNGFDGTPHTVAALRNSDITDIFVCSRFAPEDITYYDSIQECVDAVLSQKQDAAFFFTYTAEELVYTDIRNRLKVMIVPNFNIQFSIGVCQTAPTELFSILNKAALSANTDEISSIVQIHTSYLLRSYTLFDYILASPHAWFLLAAIAALFAILLALHFSRRKNARLEIARAREFERFITYVCRANDYVFELNPQNDEVMCYQVEDGHVLQKSDATPMLHLSLELIHSEDLPDVAPLLTQENLARLIQTGGELYFECRVRQDMEGQPYQWCAFNIQGIPPNGENAGSLMIFRKNIHTAKCEEEQKRQALKDALIAAQQASLAKGAFMSRMSHEIRTPLNGIIGYLTIAKTAIGEPEKLRSCMEKSEFAAQHLLSIINDVLDLSSIESGKMKIAREPFGLKSLLSGIISIFYTQACKKGVHFDASLNDLTEEKLIGDALRLKQILMNLLSNAIKFTPENGLVLFAVTQKAIIAGRVHLTLRVSDNGPGMTEAFQRRLFTPFEQQDATTARRFGGSGLGLSITKNLVGMMDGTIEVKSKEGKGSSFAVGLSFETARDGAQPAPADYDFSQQHMLVVYNAKANYAYLNKMLWALGVHSHTVHSVDEAAHELSSGSYTLCLLDLDLPECDPLADIKRLRAACTGEPPYMLAAAFDRSIVPCGLEDDHCRILLKPVFRSTLLKVLAFVCGGSLTEKPPQAQTPEATCLEGIRLLVAEDNDINMEIVTEILKSYKIHVDGVPDGQRALEAFKNSAPGDYQAILMDIQMPVMDGYEAARKIRACAHPRAKSIPIIALSADAFAEDVSRALAAGMNDHVAKPVDYAKLCAVLTRYLSHSPPLSP